MLLNGDGSVHCTWYVLNRRMVVVMQRHFRKCELLINHAKSMIWFKMQHKIKLRLRAIMASFLEA